MSLQQIQSGIQPLAAGSPESQSAGPKAQNIATLKALFPELLTERIVDGKPETAINVEVLKQLVGDTTASDAEEKYGLNWHGKRRTRQIALTPSTGTPRPCPDESVDWDTTQNLSKKLATGLQACRSNVFWKGFASPPKTVA